MVLPLAYCGRVMRTPSMSFRPEHTACLATLSTNDPSSPVSGCWDPKYLHVSARLRSSRDVPTKDEIWETRPVSKRDSRPLGTVRPRAARRGVLRAASDLKAWISDSSASILVSLESFRLAPEALLLLCSGGCRRAGRRRTASRRCRPRGGGRPSPTSSSAGYGGAYSRRVAAPVAEYEREVSSGRLFVNNNRRMYVCMLGLLGEEAVILYFN